MIHGYPLYQDQCLGMSMIETEHRLTTTLSRPQQYMNEICGHNAMLMLLRRCLKLPEETNRRRLALSRPYPMAFTPGIMLYKICARVETKIIRE